MPKYKVNMIFNNGEDYELDEIFDSYEAAEKEALYSVSCSREGHDILEMSDPFDDNLDGYEDPDYEIIEIDN